MNSDRICTKCGSDKIYAFEMCQKCYTKMFYQKNKKRIRETYRQRIKTDPAYLKKRRQYAKEYRGKNRERINKRFHLKYHTDKNFRKRVLKNHRKCHIRFKERKKRGDPLLIKAICRDFGLSEHIAEAIALDGIVLETEMKKRGIL